MDTAKENKNVIQVAIIDGNATLRNLSAKQLENSGFIILFQADTVQKAIEEIKNKGLPDVCIVEENFSAAELLLEEYSDLNILISSTDDSEESVEDMLKIGVSGYILKFAEPDEIITAIKALSGGKKYFSVGISEVATEYFSQ